MKTNEITSQLIVNDENFLKDFSLDPKFILYKGLGHVVLDSNLRIYDKDNFNKILSEYEHFFRISITEDTKSNKNEKHLFLINKDKKLKSKKLNNTDNIIILGCKFYEIILIYLGQSNNKEFHNVQQYQCIIKSFDIDQDNGIIFEEEIWNKTKYGNIEKFLPSELKDNFSDSIESMKNYFIKSFNESE